MTLKLPLSIRRINPDSTPIQALWDVKNSDGSENNTCQVVLYHYRKIFEVFSITVHNLDVLESLAPAKVAGSKVE